MWDDIDLVPRRGRGRPPAVTELWLLLAAGLVAGILSLFA